MPNIENGIIKNREECRLKERKRRKRRDPSRGLKASIWALQRGDISIDELNRRINESLVLLDEKTDPDKNSERR